MLLADLIETLQLAIGPVILISGIGLIILSLTNRFGRIVDRTRQLSVEYRSSASTDQERILLELKILSRRAKVIRNSNLLAVLSVLLVSFIIIGLFGSALYHFNMTYFLIILFISSIISLILSLGLFIYDLDLSLKALWIELPQTIAQSDHN
jgi:membrane-associated HD superfamily phosphohydrolase